jgi:UDPglucose 6-dehydrogenase
MGKPIVSVIGMGKLGTPLAALLASKGYEVVAADNRADVRALLWSGMSPVDEPGVQELLSAHPFLVEETVEGAVAASDVSFVVVPTPSRDDGSFDMAHIIDACEHIGAALRTKAAWHIVVIVSTVLPGDTRNVIIPALERASGKQYGEDLYVVYAPQFIALGSVLKNLRTPDLMLFGYDGNRDTSAVHRVRATLGSCLDADAHPQARTMIYENAELVKLAVNAFLVYKSAFASLIGHLCENLPSGDVDIVTDAVGCDSRIGPAFLMAGAPPGGPCLPRDTAALMALCERLDVDADLPEAVEWQGQSQIIDLVDKARGDLMDPRIYISSYAYKSGVEHQDTSLGTVLRARLTHVGAEVVDTVEAANVVIWTLPVAPTMDERGALLPGQRLIDVWRVWGGTAPDGVELVQVGVGS